jgi:RNA polymerase sigma-70 factor (ECF subfamily)
MVIAAASAEAVGGAHVSVERRMSELVDAYHAACPAEASMSRAGRAALQTTLAALCARGRAAHPDLTLDDRAFVAHLARCAARAVADPDAVHAEDLYVVCAALAGSATAVEKLRRRHRDTIAGYLRVLETGRASIDDIEQRLWETLLVGSPGKPPRLASYSGKGPLGAFMGVAAQWIALDSHRHGAAERRAVAGMAAEARMASGDAELSIIKRRYRKGFESALREALESLDDRERMILRMNVVDGLTFDRIAKVYRVSQPTVSRWVAKARERVLAEMRRLLRERMRLSEAEFESLAGLVVSQLDLTVSRLLRATR